MDEERRRQGGERVRAREQGKQEQEEAESM